MKTKNNHFSKSYTKTLIDEMYVYVEEIFNDLKKRKKIDYSKIHSYALAIASDAYSLKTGEI